MDGHSEDLSTTWSATEEAGASDVSIDRVDLDEDAGKMTREALVSEVLRLRAGIRAHRDSTGHDLCWYHPELWDLLPEQVDPEVAVPPWPQFLRGCVRYRESLDQELPDAPVHDQELD